MPEIIWAEGFEPYGTGTGGDGAVATRMKAGLWSQIEGTSGIGVYNDGTARTGSRYFKLQTNGSVLRRATGTMSLIGAAFGIRFPVLPANAGTWFQIRSPENSALLSFIWMTDGSIQVRKGSLTGDVLDLSDQVLFAGTWHHIEIVAAMSTTVGAIEVRVDGVAEIILTDLNLYSNNIAQIVWGTGINLGADHDLDDIVVHDGTGFLGPARVLTVFPAGDLSPFDWNITGAASGAEAVDEIPPDDDTSYIQAESEEDEAWFSMPTLPDDVIDILGIHVAVRGKQTEAGATFIQIGFVSGSEEVSGDSHALTTGYMYNQDAFSIDPNTEGLWSKESFEAAAFKLTRLAV